jgi:hypothetical protein
MLAAAAVLAVTAITGGAAEARRSEVAITLYSEPNFQGEAITLRRDVSNFDQYPPWNDRARSLVVHSGTWEVCRHAGYNKCRTLGPGANIAHLGEIKYLNEISSVRPLDGHAGNDRDWHRDPHVRDPHVRDPRDRDRWDRDPWPRPAPPPPRWDDDDIVWDGPGRGGSGGRLSACQKSVYDGFVDRYRQRARAEFAGGPQDGTIWWNGEPWRFRCARGQVNIWQDRW